MIYPKEIGMKLTDRVEDMRTAFSAEAFISALSLALTFPDVCGKLFDELNGLTGNCGERYARWFDKYVAGQDNASVSEPGKSDSDQGLEFCGADCYQLRCVFLHEASNAPHAEKQRTPYNIIQFRLFDESSAGIFLDHFSLIEDKNADESFRVLDLDLMGFIEKMAAGVLEFVADYPAANELRPINGPKAVFYAPIRDFRTERCGE